MTREEEGGSEMAEGDRARRGGRERKEPRVERLALAFDRFCAGLEERLAGSAWAINKQLQRTSASLLANVGEGLDEDSPYEQARFFDYARRAAGEAERLLKGARGRGAISDEEFARGMQLLRDIKMDLLRLMTWARNRDR